MRKSLSERLDRLERDAGVHDPGCIMLGVPGYVDGDIVGLRYGDNVLMRQPGESVEQMAARCPAKIAAVVYRDELPPGE